MSDERISHRIGSLPTKHTINGDRILTVDNLSEDDIPLLYSAIQGRCNDATVSRQPFGEDEFPTEYSFREFLRHSYAVVLRDEHDTDSRAAFGFVSPARIQRTDRPTYAELQVAVFATEDAQDRCFHEQMLELLMKLAADIGYAGCMQTLFSSDAMALQVASSAGFLPVLYAPKSGKVSARCRDSVMFFRWLSDQSRKEMTLDKASELPEKLLSTTCTERPLLTYLPKTRLLANGREMRVRYMEDRDVPGAHAMWDDAIQRGAGYAVGELPPIEVMYETLLADGNIGSFVLETIPDGKFAGAMNIHPQPFCRSATPEVADVNVVVHPDFYGQGLGTEIIKLYFRFARDMGYSGCATDTFANNAAMWHILQKQGMQVIGCVPLSGHVQNTGCVDSYMFYKDLSAGGLVEL